MSKVIALLLMSFLVVSCGEKKGMSSVKLKLFQSSITTGTDMSGGILLMGRSEDGLNSFRTSIGSVSESLTMDLAKGRWEFAAVGWSNTSGPMTGDNRCAYSGFVDLKDSEVNVTFDMKQDRCLTNFNGNQFSDTNYMTSGGKFLDFFPVMCNNSTAASTNCSYLSNPTSIVSYKVIYKPEAKGLVTGNFTALSSNCLGVGGSVRTKIPVTSDANGSPLKVSVQFFKNSTCDGTPEFNFDFNNGIASTQLPVWSQAAPQAGYYSYLYINPGMQYDMIAVNPSAFSLVSPVNSGAPVFSTPMVTYTLSSIPENVSEVCFTVESTCPANKWISKAQAATGSLLLDGMADGTYYLKAFYKTVSGVVSTTYAEALFSIDLTPPMAVGLNSPVASVTNGIDVTWSSTDDGIFDHWTVYVCPDSSCGTIIGSKTVSDFNTKYANLGSSDLGGATITLGQNYCIFVKAYDLFNRASSYAPICTTTTN